MGFVDSGGLLGAGILAAGRGSRIGKPKALLPWRGFSFIQHLFSVYSSLGIPLIGAAVHPQVFERRRELSVIPLPSEGAERLIPSLGRDVFEAVFSALKGRLDSFPYRVDLIEAHWSGEGASEEERSLLVWIEGDPERDPYDSLRRIWGVLRGVSSSLVVGPVDQGPISSSLVGEFLRSVFGWRGRRLVAAVPCWRGRPGHPVFLSPEGLALLERDYPCGLRDLLSDLGEGVVEFELPYREIIRNINTEMDYLSLGPLQNSELER